MSASFPNRSFPETCSRIVPAAICSLGLLFTGCVANQAYRDRDSRPWAPPGDQPVFVRGEQLDQYEPYKADDPSHRFGVGLLAERCRTRNVCEDDGDCLSALGHGPSV